MKTFIFKFTIVSFIALLVSLPTLADTFFHITDLKNVDSIRENGLLTSHGGKENVGFGSKFMGDRSTCKGHVHLSRFLTKDEAAMNGVWGGVVVKGYLDMARYFGRRETVLLAVELNKEQLGLLKSDPKDEGAVRADFDIPPSQIVVLGNGDEWLELLSTCGSSECASAIRRQISTRTSDRDF